MRELPILFSAPMVRAILDDRKTATRRVVKLPPAPSKLGKWEATTVGGPGCVDRRGNAVPEVPAVWHTRTGQCFSAAYQVGDRLWVKEAWRAPASLDACSGTDMAERCLEAGYRKPWAPMRFEADGVLNSPKDWREFGSTPGEATPGRYRHARFMPRWASRITLEVTAVRVERLQDITEDEAQAEGVAPGFLCEDDVVRASARYVNGFRMLWDDLAKDGTRWADNPWVWVVEFRRIEGVRT